MSDQPSSGDQQHVPESTPTQPMTSAQTPPPPQPPPAAPIATGPPGGGRGWIQRAWAIVLAILVGFGAGALFTAQSKDEPLLEEEKVVLYEGPSSAFPVAGGAFAPSFFNESTQRCELDKFVSFMNQNPERKQAWLEIRGLSEDQFDPLMDRLREARITKHTPVTNHGYRDGRWFEVHSVLAPGTPVMIDPQRGEEGGGHPTPTDFEEDEPTPTDFEEDEPTPTDFDEPTPIDLDDPTPEPKDDFLIVVKCNCGNPIKEPKCPPNCEGGPPRPSTEPPDTDEPTERPTDEPTASPTERPTEKPTEQPTEEPTERPTEEPTDEPAQEP